MYRYLGIGLLGLFVLMVLPTAGTVDSVAPHLYGAASILIHDNQGTEIFRQQVHNQLTNDGENFIIHQVFNVTGAGATNNNEMVHVSNGLIGTICVTDNLNGGTSGAPGLEAMTAANFDADVNRSSTGLNVRGGNCLSDWQSGVDNTTNGVAVISPLHSFVTLKATAANGNFDNDALIDGIGICSAAANPLGANGTTCLSGASALFAVVDVSNVTLGGGETATVTYTFDISDANS